MLSLTAGDGSALSSLTFAAIQRGVDTAHVSLRVTNTGLTEVTGSFLEIFTEQTPGMLDWISSGSPPVDEQWGRFQATSTGGSTLGQELWNDAVQPMGNLSVAELPPIKAGNWVIGDFWLRQPSTSAGGTAVNIRLVVAGDEPARGVPSGVASSAWGVLSGVNLIRSFLISGGVATATGTPDDEVHIAARSYLLGSIEYSAVAADVTLNQNDGAAAALTTGQGYWAAISQSATAAPTTTKGLKGASPTKPTVPAGELLLAFVLVSYDAGGSTIATGDIDQDLTFGRLLAVAPTTGLSVVIHAGESLAGGFQQFHATKQTLALTGTASNWIWMEYSGTLTVTTTATAPSAAAIPLWIAVTSGSAVTSLVDLRPFIGITPLLSKYGGGIAETFAEEEITLATGSTTTDSVADLLPASARILAVTYVVTTTITTAANFKVGDVSTVDRFVTVTTGITAGSQGVGLNHLGSSEKQTTAGKVRVTTNANPGAGKIRVQVHSLVFTAPSA